MPRGTPHSVLNSLPEWQDNVNFALGRRDLIGEVDTTYSRFGIHPFVKQLTDVIIEASDRKHGGQYCLLFPTRMLAEECQSFIEAHVSPSTSDVRSVTEIAQPPPPHQVFAVFFAAEQRAVMRFYTFSGGGISTRLAELCLTNRAGLPPALGIPPPAGHYYSEYYRRYSPLTSVSEAKAAIRFRFSGMIEGGANIRGVPGASPDDVFPYASGMQAIWRAYRLVSATIGAQKGSENLKVAHINLIYTDSYKFPGLNTSSGYHFFADDGLDELEALLERGTPSRPAILALYTDFPGNPHLRCADLPRLRALADRYNFPIIIDETAGGYVNMQILPYCDVVVSSITKLFSGHANVLGGALMLNPASRFYAQFKTYMEATYEDSYFDNEALVMELNSREVVSRTAIVNRNAEALADMLHARAAQDNSVVAAVHYPKYRTRENYDRCRNPLAEQAGLASTGYGPLLAVTFKSLAAAKRFYSALRCYKGATLGTVFTLATAFTAIAVPPDEMQWAKDHGVEESLVRFSVGMEDTAAVLECVSNALDLTEQRETGSDRQLE
ncbi:pyridoxal phosphate-dependent transferase [Mycena sp. CBHHK59/15]|nr:pyridoxal phosphate-dependent transferase [Mycena sp. CBHHK59/15]